VPAVTPVTMPLEEPTDAFVLLLLQLPPGVPSVKVIVEPGQTANVLPPIAEGRGLTVTGSVAVHPVPSE
jgi:hypothetical protein